MKIQTILEINAPASAVWKVFGEGFADVSNYAESITKSSINGPLESGVIRTCDIKAFGPVAAGQITEKLTHFDRTSHALTFAVLTGAPNIMKSIENAWTIEALGDNRSKVTSLATFGLKWWALPLSPLLRFQLSRGIRDFMKQLKAYVEARN
ncbi:MAG: SRPBCC family protein [Thermodesulfobacteriota bacterium]